MKQWKLKHASFARVASGHPWVFSNELDQSPKGIEPGDLIELIDAKDRFLGIGFGHPQNLIAFRFLSRVNRAVNQEFFHDIFVRAIRRRIQVGLQDYSFRMLYGESDEFPGLVVDRFVLRDGYQVLSVQVNSAGAERLKEIWFPALLKAVEMELGRSTRKTAVVWCADSKGRLFEGLEVFPKRIEIDFAQKAEGFNWNRVHINLQPLTSGGVAQVLAADLLAGQKTGFFLDQRSNVQSVWSLLASGVANEVRKGERPFRILDLFCYVGQWGAQICRSLVQEGVDCEVHCVDSSESALQLARYNIEMAGGVARPLKLDIVDELGKIPNQNFDLVVCDPPAFIKQKKDLANGKSAYLKLNREALRKTCDDGVFVTCSCSGHLSEEEFREILSKASASQRIGLRLFSRGGHAADHPQLPPFLQGSYLKCWIGRVDWKFFEG